MTRFVNFMLACSMTIMMGCKMNYKNFVAVTATQSGEFELEMSADEALPLFTAPGEKLWVSKWDPAILHGDGFEPGTVWVTFNHGSTTYWYVQRYNTEAKNARYVRVTPDSDMGTVEVSLSPLSDNRTKVSVTYQLTVSCFSRNWSFPCETLVD